MSDPKAPLIDRLAAALLSTIEYAQEEALSLDHLGRNDEDCAAFAELAAERVGEARVVLAEWEAQHRSDDDTLLVLQTVPLPNALWFYIQYPGQSATMTARMLALLQRRMTEETHPAYALPAPEPSDSDQLHWQVSQWQDVVREGDTTLGYNDWVREQAKGAA